jgi:hypothetical protein
MEDIVSEVIDDVEELFTPKPGGMIDRHHQEQARRQAAQQEKQNIDQRIEESSYKAVKTAPQSPESFSPISFTIQPGGTQQILPLSPYRYRAVVMVNETAVETDTPANSGTVNAPGAGATIVQVALPPGTYSVAWNVQLSGTLAAPADLNNFQLFQSGTGSNVVIVGSLNLTVAGTYPQPPVIATSANANNFIKVLTVGASTAGSVYGAQLILTPLAVGVGPVILARDSGAALGGQGFELPAATPLPLLTRAQVYAFNAGGVPARVTVLSEIYAPEK